MRRSVAAPDLPPTRARILEHLQRNGAGLAVDDVAAAVRMHPNSVRAALDQLVADGLVVRDRRAPVGRGRPARLYRADPRRSEPDPRVREYGALAGALAAHIAATSPDPAADAAAAGVRWGRALVARLIGTSDAAAATETATTGNRDGLPAPQRSVPPRTASARKQADAQARRRVIELLASLEFGPRPDRASRSATLTTCPLLDVAREHPGVVCQVHRGLVAGALDALGASAHDVDLVPFAKRDGCALRMTEAVTR